MKAIVERHGGTVEKFIGDAVMAVFGVPVVHEDDALRALPRGGRDARRACPSSVSQARIGVNTGEVVTGTEERLATGDAVNVAARLEQAAEPGEILIGEETLRLSRDAVEVERGRAARAEGQGGARSRPTGCFGRTADERRAAPRRADGRPRDGAAAALRDAFEQAVADASLPAVHVLGPAGVGQVAAGRRVPRLARGAASCAAAAFRTARASPTGRWSRSSSSCRRRTVDRRSPPRRSRACSATRQRSRSSEEIAWAFRKLLEAVAAETPARRASSTTSTGARTTFLDLIEHVADLSRDAPILLLCMARPELLDRRPAGPAAR